MESPVILRKMWLRINGADRMIICEPEKETLSDVLRRIGLTGTKVGCGTGVCGACSVILNGKLIRSCTKKVRTIEDYSEIITIEGIGTPTHLHPLQEAWIACGAVQCGFCTPGFIVSAYALLLENPDPTRQEVRDWFTKHRNICRCTGYKPLVDAVMMAAKVMRGEATMDEFKFKNPEDNEYYGKAVPRPAALAKVCGLAEYGDDLALKMPAGTLHVAIVQPKTTAHAKILNIDCSVAEKMPGVVRILTAKDVQGSNHVACNLSTWKKEEPYRLPAPILCDDKIYNYGSVVALVCADTRENARAAAAAVKVEIEQLPEYKDYSSAAAPDAVDVVEGVPNVAITLPLTKGDYKAVPSIIDNAPYSVSGSFSSTREPHMSIEGDSVQAYWDEDGKLTIHCKSQTLFQNINDIAEGIGMPKEKLRIVLNTTGGSFGWSMFAGSYAMAAVATMATGRPVELYMSYAEHQAYSGKRSPSCSNIRLSADENGIMNAVEYQYGIDSGPVAQKTQWLVPRVLQFTGWGYRIANVAGMAYMAHTNHSMCVPYRGFGAPQTFTTSESIVDMLAAKVGMDPFEFRVKNLADSSETTPAGYPYRENTYKQLFEVMRPYYEKAKEEAKAADTPEKRRGVGVSLACYVCTDGKYDDANTRLELCPDGSIEVFNTWEDMGQGGDVGNIMLVLEALKPLKLTPERIRIRTCDTKTNPPSGSAAGSRSHMMNGQAIKDAARQLLEAMTKEDGTFRTYNEMIAEGRPVAYNGYYTNEHLPLTPYGRYEARGDEFPTLMYGVVLAEVEVDTATGKTKVLGYTMVSDVGVVGNIQAVDGQAYGGASHCIGFALTENYDDEKKHNNILGAGVPTCNDIPDDEKFKMIYVENYRENCPFGSSGCSELFQSGGHVAVLNAIYNACGVRIYTLPATPDKVKKALNEISETGHQADPEPFYIAEKSVLEDIEINLAYKDKE